MNLTSIAILDSASPPTIAAPYPSNIAVAGVVGTITQVTVKLNCICHTFPDDIDILLVGPAGQNAIIMSDVGGSIAVGPCGTPTPTATATATPTPTPACSKVCNLTEGFDDITTLVPGGWVMQNNSQPGPGTTGWFQGNSAVFVSQCSGSANSYIAANFNNGTGTSTLSNWLLTPPVILQNGAQFSFWTRTTNGTFPDRLQVRMSTNGCSTELGNTATSVGDFSTLVLDINPTYTSVGYPTVWTQFTVTLSGLIPSPTSGRLAFRYFVENGGPSGANSDYIGIDSVQYACNGDCQRRRRPGTPHHTNADGDLWAANHIGHCQLLPESGPSTNARCDDDPDW